MSEKKLAPEAAELNEESLEQVAGGTNVVTIHDTTEVFHYDFTGDTKNGDILKLPDINIK